MDPELNEMLHPPLWPRFLASTVVLLLVIGMSWTCEIPGLPKHYAGIASASLLLVIAIFAWGASVQFIRTALPSSFMHLLYEHALWMIPFCLASAALLVVFDMTTETRIYIAAVIGSVAGGSIATAFMSGKKNSIACEVSLDIIMVCAGCGAIIGLAPTFLIAIPFMVLLAIVGNRRVRRALAVTHGGMG